MQTRFLKFAIVLNDYRTMLLAILVVTVLVAFLVMPSSVVEAGKAISNGG